LYGPFSLNLSDFSEISRAISLLPREKLAEISEIAAKNANLMADLRKNERENAEKSEEMRCENIMSEVRRKFCAENGPKMAENGENWSKNDENRPKMDENGPKIAQNRPKFDENRPKIDENDRKSPKNDENSIEILESVRRDLENLRGNSKLSVRKKKKKIRFQQKSTDLYIKKYKNQ
jgi:hypothetical protein